MYKIIECTSPTGKIYLIWNSKTRVYPTDRFFTSREEAEITKGHLGPPGGYFSTLTEAEGKPLRLSGDSLS